jgi:hypothetical protein
MAPHEEDFAIVLADFKSEVIVTRTAVLSRNNPPGAATPDEDETAIFPALTTSAASKRIHTIRWLSAASPE